MLATWLAFATVCGPAGVDRLQTAGPFLAVRSRHEASAFGEYESRVTVIDGRDGSRRIACRATTIPTYTVREDGQVSCG